MKSLMAVTYTSWLMVGFTSFSVTSVGEDGARCCVSAFVSTFCCFTFYHSSSRGFSARYPMLGQGSAVLSSGSASEG